MPQQEAVLTFVSARPDFKGTLVSFMSPPDQVAFERHFGVGMGEIESERRVEWILWLVWRAWRRESRDTADFEVFLEDLTDYDLPADVAPDPTEEAPPG